MKHILVITIAAAAMVVVFSFLSMYSGPAAPPSGVSSGYQQGLVWEKANPILSLAFFLSLATLALSTYLLPSIVAGLRHHHNIGALMVINFLVGRLSLGWAA